MNKVKSLLPIIFVSLVIFVALFSALKPVNAFSLTDTVNQVKNLLSNTSNSKDNSGTIFIQPSITLAPDGDVNGNGKIDSGDILRFDYKIVNSSSNGYDFGELDTNINSKLVNSIHNVHATSLDNSKGTITFPNLRLRPLQVTDVSFDARVIYSADSDVTLSTDAVFIDKSKNVLSKASHIEVKALKNNKLMFNAVIKHSSEASSSGILEASSSAEASNSAITNQQ